MHYWDFIDTKDKIVHLLCAAYLIMIHYMKTKVKMGN